MYLQASGKGINNPWAKDFSSCYMKLLAFKENEPLQHDNSTEEILQSDTEKEMLEESCAEIETQTICLFF